VSYKKRQVALTLLKMSTKKEWAEKCVDHKTNIICPW